MKNLIKLCFVIIMLSACSKEPGPLESTIIGRWQLVEIFQGYANGGNFKWNDVPLDQSIILEFTSGLQYFEFFSTGQQICIGTYKTLPDNFVETDSSCQTIINRNKVSTPNSRTLIIDHQGREGVVRKKYKLIK